MPAPPRLAALAALLLLGCPKRAPEPEPPPPPDPLDRALTVLGTDRAGLALPRAEEAGYRTALRYPVVDAALARPTALPTLGERVGAALDAAEGPEQTFDALRLLAPAGSSGVAAAPIRPGPPVPASNDLPGLPGPVEALTSPRGLVRTEHLPPLLREALVDLAGRLEALHEASAGWDLRGGPLAAPPRSPEEYFLDPETGRSRFLTHPTRVQEEFLRACGAADHAALWAGARDLLVAARSWAERLRTEPGALPPKGEAGGVLLHLETSLGPIVVGSAGPDRLAGDALLAIDPGGDDLWTGSAGSNVGIPGRAALAIDLGGADRYQSLRPHSQGAGYGGIGVLLDAGTENDGYFASAHAQGAGFFGVGVLWDEGGDDGYQGERFVQGAGTFGVGLLVDRGGSDRLVARSRGQGFGSTAGLGALLDLAGDDQRRLGVSGAEAFGPDGGGGQGAAWGIRPFPWNEGETLHGGVGLLYDRAGDDVSYARASAQGAGRMLSLGLHLDRAGDDTYRGEDEAQGAAVHLAAGLLLDSAGADSYRGTRLVQGAGVDRAAGLLVDRGGGADRYAVSVIGPRMPGVAGGGQGWARETLGFGLLVDEGGDDRYEAERDAQGSAVLPARPGPDPHGLLLDLGGADGYVTAVKRPGTNPADGATWIGEELGLGSDGEGATVAWDPFPDAVDPVGPAPEQPPRPAPPEAWSTAPDEPALAHPDAALRFAEVERLTTALAESDAPEHEALRPRLRELAGRDRDLRVRRQAALALWLAGDGGGVGAIIAGLEERTEDHDGGGGPRTVPGLLRLLTGAEVEPTAEAWRAWWLERGETDDPAPRRAAVAAVLRAVRAAEEARPADVELWCARAGDLLPGDEPVRRRCGGLLDRWAWVLRTEESPRYDPALAERLARLGVRFEPDRVGHFANLAAAGTALGRSDMLIRLLEKVALLDPDHPELPRLRVAAGLPAHPEPPQLPQTSPAEE